MDEELQPKPWTESLTIQGQILQVIPAVYGLCRMIGLDLPDGVLEAVLNGFCAVVFVAGMIMSVLGRFRATQKLSK